MNMANVAQQHLVAFLPSGREAILPLVIGRRGDLHTMLTEHGTDRLHTPSQPAVGGPVIGVLADEIHDH